MKLAHIFLLLVLLAVAGLAACYIWARKGPPAEVEISLDRPNRGEEAVEKSDTDDSVPVPDVAHTPGTASSVADGFDANRCRWLVRHIPRDDVAYKPGVDVRGKPVVPADLNGTYNIELPKSIEATVSRRLLSHPNLRQETPFATVEIDLSTGAVRINGQGLTNREHEDLIAYCASLD
jgi:hypothetical protein